MIVSIVFRSGVESVHLRNWINRRCIDLEKYTQEITRVQVVITRVSHQIKSSSAIQCHISIQASGRKYIDIFEKNSSEGGAFNKCFERASAELSQQYSGHGFQRRDVDKFLYASEEYLYGNL